MSHKNRIIRRLGGLCIGLVLAQTLTFAQKTKTTTPSPKPAGSSSKSPATPEQEQALAMRQEHLKNLRVYLLARTLENIKKTDEPALRISTRNELLKYLVLDKAPSAEDKAQARTLAEENLSDLNDHSDEIMPSLAMFLLTDLGAWVRTYQPDLTEKVEALEKSKFGDTGFQDINALLQTPGGEPLAVQHTIQNLEAGKDMPELIFLLDILKTRKSQEFEPLLSKIVEVAARGELSFNTLFSLQEIYFSLEIPVALKQRFAEMIVARTQPASLGKDVDLLTVYYMLTNALPAIRQLTPELYGQAVNQRLVIYSSLNKGELANIERAKQHDESPSAAEDTTAEADETTSKTRRHDLLAEALQLALEKKKYELCLDILAKLNPEPAGESDEGWKNWTNQIVQQFITGVLEEKKTELAEKGAVFAATSLGKVQALILIIQYQGKANNKTVAQRLLAEATSIAGGIEDNVEKARAFLLLTSIANQLGGPPKPELLETAIRALNDVTMPDRSTATAEGSPYQQYVWKLNGAERYYLVSNFKNLTKKDDDRAQDLLEKLARPESKSFASIGILQGVRELLLPAKALK